LQLGARKPPREQFASRADRRRYFIWQVQRGTVAAGAVAFAACAVLASERWLEAVRLHDEARAQFVAARQAASQYERITAAFPVTETTTDNLKVAVDEFRRIADRTASPEQALVHVSHVLERFPQVELDAVRWRVERPGERRNARNGQPVAAPAQENAVTVEITGRVNATQRNDYRGITAQVQQLAAGLVGAGYEPVRTQLPFDVTSEGTLTGDITSRAESGEAPRFTIVLSRKLP
jgi:hypothetical protein